MPLARSHEAVLAETRQAHAVSPEIGCEQPAEAEVASLREELEAEARRSLI